MSAHQDIWQPPVSARDNGYISAAPLARVLRWMFGGWVVLAALGTSSSYWCFRTLSDVLDGAAGVDVNQADTIGAIAMAVEVVELFATLATGVTFIVWTRRVYRNVAALGGEMRYKPGWAVGGWFVPFLNLVRPKQIVDDAWRGSAAAAREGPEREEPLVLDVWWTFFLVATIGSRLLFRQDDAISRSSAQYFAIRTALELAWMVAAVLAFWVVVRVTDRQEAKAASRWPAAGAVDESWPTVQPQHGSLQHESLLRWLLPAIGIMSLVVSSGLLAARPHSGLAPAAMRVGDCFDRRDRSGSDEFEPDLVSCDELHEAEIYAMQTMSTSELPPLESQRMDDAMVYCRSEFEVFVGAPYEESVYALSVVWQEDDVSLSHDLQIGCAIFRPDHVPTRGSAAGARE